MFIEKPSCIKELKRLASDLVGYDPINETGCINQIRNVLTLHHLKDKEKLLKIKEICNEYAK